jgi:hypothetical protein
MTLTLTARLPTTARAEGIDALQRARGAQKAETERA